MYEFLARSIDGKLVFKNQEQFHKAVLEKSGEEMIVILKDPIRGSEKTKMYAYFHHVVIPIMAKSLTNEGWEGVDDVKAEYVFKTLFAKSIMYNKKTDQEEVFLVEKKSMDISRLHKFLTDCITYLEIEKGIIVPDSSEWKKNKKYSK